MVHFSGFDMPLSCTKGVQKLNACGLLDVSHMVQSRYQGKSLTEFLSKLPSPLKSMNTYTSTTSVIMNEKGGILDNFLITRWGEEDWYLATNAGRRESDLA
ncbi:hypothetical protein PSHT_04082, partial [Puccinia striiformis]